MNDFERLFEKLAKTDDASILWINWLDWVIDQNLICIKDQELDFKGHQKYYFELYCEWIKIVENELTNTNKFYYDYLGVFYEDVIQSKYKAGTNGQFFTPQDVSKLMSSLFVTDEKESVIDELHPDDDVCLVIVCRKISITIGSYVGRE